VLCYLCPALGLWWGIRFLSRALLDNFTTPDQCFETNNPVHKRYTAAAAAV
jgi:hypothetical protein